MRSMVSMDNIGYIVDIALLMQHLLHMFYRFQVLEQRNI